MGPKAKTEEKKPAEEKASEGNELEPDDDDENKAKNKKIPEVQALEGEQRYFKHTNIPKSAHLTNIVTYNFAEIRENCRLIERSILTKEQRFVMRVLRNLFVLRKQVTPLLLRRVVVGYYTHSTESKDQLLGFVPTEDETAMDVDGSGGSDKSAAALLATTRLRGAKSALEPLRPEVRKDLRLFPIFIQF